MARGTLLMVDLK